MGACADTQLEGTGVLPDGSVSNTELEPMAANTVKGNATASTAAPQDIAVPTNTVVGRLSGNIVVGQVNTGQVAANCITTAKITDANVTLAKMADLAAATIIGRAEGAGTGVPTALSATQVATILDQENIAWTGTATWSNQLRHFTGNQVEAGALPLNITTAATTTHLVITTAGDGDITDISGSTFGRVLYVLIFGSGTKRLVTGVGSDPKMQMPGVLDHYVRQKQTFMLVGRGSGEGWIVVGLEQVQAFNTAPPFSNASIPFMVRVSCPSGGAAGTADDVTVWNGDAPFALRILDVTLRVSTAVVGSSAALRTASGGGGTVVLPDPTLGTQTFSTATTGPFDDVAVATATVASAGSLFLRRSDRSVVGELVLTCIRT